MVLSAERREFSYLSKKGDYIDIIFLKDGFARLKLSLFGDRISFQVMRRASFFFASELVDCVDHSNVTELFCNVACIHATQVDCTWIGTFVEEISESEYVAALCANK